MINNVLAFYQNTFSDTLTVHIEFHNMNSGLGQSSSWIYNVAYSSYRSALAADAKTTDDATALANTPAASTNPVTGSTNVDLTSPAGRAVGLNTSELQFGQESSCPSFTGAGCIGINVSLANSHGALISVLEHEIDEVLGLGSALSGNTTPTDPELEDLFRWSSPGVRSFAAGFQTTNPCGSTPPYFSINGGTTHLDDFNNCNNGGDYGDWTTHTPSQVQDAFTNFSAAPSLTSSSPEVRALDVIGFDAVTGVVKKVRGQTISN